MDTWYAQVLTTKGKAATQAATSVLHHSCSSTSISSNNQQHYTPAGPSAAVMMQQIQTSLSGLGQLIALLSLLVIASTVEPAAAGLQQAGVPLTTKGRFQTESAAKPTTTQAQLLQRCLASARPSGAGGSLSVTFQQDAKGYKLLQTRNAQLRGARIMPLAFVQPASSADVSAAVRCSVEAGLRFVARNGG
jgi:hypothetical protein